MNSRTLHGWALPLLLLLSAELVATAQDYRRYGPQPPPSAPAPSRLPDNLSPVQGSPDDFEVTLKGVAFVDSPAKVSSHAGRAAEIETHQIELLQHPDFKAVVAPYLGKKISLRGMNELVRDVILYCRRHDRPVVDVSIPEQDFTGGVVQFVIIVGKMDKVVAQGNHWFSNALMQDGITMQPGKPVSSSTLLDDLDTLNRNPFRSSSAVLTPGSEVGSTDIIVQTQDRFPLRVYTGYDDTGNGLTGYDRWMAGFNWGNAFGLGHQLNYQFTTSSNVDALVAHSGSYVVPLPWRHTLTLYGAASTSNVLIPGFDLRGGGSQIGLRYDVPFGMIRNDDAAKPVTFGQSVYAGYDWKQSNNFVEFGVIPVTNTITDIGEFVLGYKGDETDPWGVTSFNPEVDWNPAAGWSFQDSSDYAAARPGADPSFTYFKAELTRTTLLPWGFSLYNDLRGQIATTNLLPTEQLVFGGEDSIRGYDDQDLNGTDEGWISRNEIRFPSLSLGKCISPTFGQHVVADQLQFLGFFDYGEAWAHQGVLTLNNGQTSSEVTFEGAGPGLRYTIGPYVSVKADYGFQLHDTGSTTSSRWHLAVTFSY